MKKSGCQNVEISPVGNPHVGAVAEGGENRFVHKLPNRGKHPDLVLKRGVMAKASRLCRWCSGVLESGLGSPIEPKTLNVYLLNEKGDTLRGWSFPNAYPVKWEIDALDSRGEQVATKSIALSYTCSNRIDLGDGSIGPE